MVDHVVKTVPLQPDLGPRDVSPVSLHVLAKNAESVIGRLLDCVLPYVAEIRLVLNDTTDKTAEVVLGRMAKFPDARLVVSEVTATSHPQFYMSDVRKTYEAGKPFCGEIFEGPFTGQPLLCDWAGARNVGWESDAKWRLFLDADDVVADPEKIPGLVRILDGLHADLAATKYVFGRSENGAANSVAYRERLALNSPGIGWEGKTHEILKGGFRHVLVEDCLLVTDLKDNWGRGVRVPGRCFKVLYRDARLAHWKVSSRHLAYLVQEAPGMMALSWVEDLVDYYMASSVWPPDEEVAWVQCMVGEMREARENYEGASVRYLTALDYYHSSKAAFRLCRARFMLKNWVGCIEAYQRGVTYLQVPQVLDAGPVYEHSSKILVAQAYYALGRLEEAQTMIVEAAKIFPGSSAVLALRNCICGEQKGEG